MSVFALRKKLAVILAGLSLAVNVSGLAAAEARALPLPEFWRDGAPMKDLYLWQSLPSAVEVIPPQLFNLVIPDHPSIKKNMDFLQDDGRPWMEECLENSIPYKDFIFQQLEEYKVPSEFFFLAAVESSFNASAVSRAGAVGMWQFMKNSIYGYDMSVTPYIDERKDFWKSTIGALRKLKDNYNYYGDWYLALAAYNAGTPRVDKAIKKSGGIKDYWALIDKGYLPRETSGYVPQILAMVKLASNKSKFGLPMTWDDPHLWVRIPIERTIDLRLLAEAAQVPLDQLLSANRELKYPITPNDMAYNLKVPAAWAEPVKKALNDPNLKLIKFYFYTIQKGDTLSELAQWYGISVATIQKYNNGVNPDNLQINKTLIIPALKEVPAFQKKAVAKPPVPEVPANGGPVYVIKAGDTLFSIARRVGTTPETLASLNRISVNDSIDIGQKLVLPAGAPYAP